MNESCSQCPIDTYELDNPTRSAVVEAARRRASVRDVSFSAGDLIVRCAFNSSLGLCGSDAPEVAAPIIDRDGMPPVDANPGWDPVMRPIIEFDRSDPDISLVPKRMQGFNQKQES